MKFLYALAITLAATTACKEQVEATVQCKVNEGPVVDCDITQTKGKAEVEVCWDFNVKCANDATLTANRTCGSVKDGETTPVNIPSDKIKLEGQCQGETTAEVVNIKLKGL